MGVTTICETKAAVLGLTGARAALRRIGERAGPPVAQRDTFFVTAHGLLKLRESRGGATLVAYRRPAGTGLRTCDVAVTGVDDPAACRSGLAAVLGTLGEVHKVREAWAVGPLTRVHLDDVRGLGTFVEIETTGVEGEAAAAHLLVAAAVGVDPHSDLRRSYAELLGLPVRQ